MATYVVCETFAIYLVRSFCCAFLTAANKYSLGKEEELRVDAKKAYENLSPKRRRKNSQEKRLAFIKKGMGKKKRKKIKE